MKTEMMDKIVFDAEISERKILKIPVGTIVATPYNPSDRTQAGAELRRLVKTVKQYGVIQPIIITADRDLVDGNRRLAAAKIAGMTHIECIILDQQVEKDHVFGDLNTTCKKLNNRGWMYACRYGIKNPPKEIEDQYRELSNLVGTHGVDLLIEKKFGLTILTLCKLVKAQGVPMRLDEIIMRVAKGKLSNRVNMACRSKTMSQMRKVEALVEILMEGN